jgi:Uma2 family endonuclease
LLYGIGWDGYQKVLDVLANRPIRLTYDRGDLELMSPLAKHERYKQLLGRVVEVVTEELDIPMIAAGSTTFSREDVDRGLEPDQCFYIANAGRIHDQTRIDLNTDPPPDLAVEIDITSSSLDRLGIYAALAIPEVWRFDGETLDVLLLQADGTYSSCANSSAFPFLPMQEVARRLIEYDLSNDSRWGREVRAWVRNEVGPRFRAQKDDPAPSP